MNKLKKIQIFRIIIQIIMLFLLPGLFIMAFNGLKEVVKMVLSGNFGFIQALPSLLEFVTVTIFTIISGRFFCGWLCAFGTYSDLIYLMSKKIFKTRFRMNEKIDSYLKYAKYIILLAIILVSCILGSTIFRSASPWDAFAQITDFPDILKSLPVGLLLLLLITAGMFFVERFFCRYLCPLGAFFTLISKVSFLKIKKPSGKCGICRVCTNNCSMGLRLYKTENVRGGDCINCLKCIDACPRKNTCVNTFGQDVNSALASSVAIAAFAGIYGINSLGGYVISQRDLNSSSSAVTSTVEAAQKYKDGTYTGTGTGFRGGTTEIEVTIKKGKITSITTVSYQDTPRFYESVFDTEVNKIISSQSTDIDTVSGATYSCAGIISAVQDALSKAANNTVAYNDSGSSLNTMESTDAYSTADSSGSTEEPAESNSKQSNTSGSTETKSDTANSSSTAAAQHGKYKDGTYTGTGTGFRGGKTSISVTVSGGKITAIETLSTDDTLQFYNSCAEIVISNILSSQSASVDTVSGATYSSNGIIAAVKDALSNAI